MKSNIIEVKNLTRTFGDFTAVDSISFDVKAGEVFAFLWPNGAGKTTTIKILTTLLNASKWDILINGFSPKTQQNQVRSSIGIVFQDPSLDDELTSYENMTFHAALYGVNPKIAKQRIIDLLHLVELRDRKDAFVKTFSGGMKRRLEIARGLIHYPKILFLDEPSTGLDPQTRNFLWDYINKLTQTENMTVFLTTHYMEEAEKMADRIAIIDHGKIIATGTSEDLKKQTKTDNLEDAFLKLTGSSIREESADTKAGMRRMAKMRR